MTSYLGGSTLEDCIKELLDCREKYGNLFEFCPDAVFIHYNYKIIYANPAAVSISEAENVDRLIGITIDEFLHPEYKSLIRARVKEIYKENCEVPLMEQKYITFKGKIVDVEVSGAPFNYKGKICCISFVRDITARRQTEEKLKKSNRKFEILVNHMNDVVVLQKFCNERKNFYLDDVNDAACKRYEYAKEELLKKTMYDISKNTFDDYASIFEKLSNQGRVMHYSNEISKSGAIIPVEVNSVIFDIENERYMLSISRDMRERIEVEGQLIESELQYRTLIEDFPYGIFIVTNNNELLFANKTGIEYLGLTLEEVILSDDLYSLFQVDPMYQEEFNYSINKLVETGHMPLTELRFLNKRDGSDLDLEMSVSSINYENEKAYLIITKDISEKKKAEELQKSMDEKNKLLQEVVEYEKLRTEFFANISHELRTPINIILTSLQLFDLKLNAFGNEDSSDKGKKYIATMKQNCYRLIRLINNLIDATKIDSGYFELELRNNNIVSVVEDITLSIAEYIENKGISVVFDTDIEEKIIACDPDKIERIMLNLISNAVKFTEVGGHIFVTIRDKGERVEISVRDTGIGIPKEKQQNIFRRFVQVDKSLTRNREGSGIGLSLVKSLVELHKGSIELISETGKGSEFIIDLPVYVIEVEKENKSSNNYNIQSNIEKISVEFSDIYL